MTIGGKNPDAQIVKEQVNTPQFRAEYVKKFGFAAGAIAIESKEYARFSLN